MSAWDPFTQLGLTSWVGNYDPSWDLEPLDITQAWTCSFKMVKQTQVLQGEETPSTRDGAAHTCHSEPWYLKLSKGISSRGCC